MKTHLLIFIFILSCFTISAQENKIKIKKEAFDKMQKDALIDMVYNYVFNKKTSDIALNKGQKAVYFISIIDDEILNGGFVDMFLKHKSAFNKGGMEGLELIGDTSSYSIFARATSVYLKNEVMFKVKDADDDLPKICIGKLETLYLEYADVLKQREKLLYNYIKLHHQQFVIFDE